MEGDRTPDFEMRVWLSPAGYQKDILYRGEVVSSGCMSFKGSLEDGHIDHWLHWLRVECAALMNKMRGKI